MNSCNCNACCFERERRRNKNNICSSRSSMTQSSSSSSSSFVLLMMMNNITLLFNNDESVYDNGKRYYFNSTNISITMDGLPPAPIAWIYNTIDIVWYIVSYMIMKLSSIISDPITSSSTNWRYYITFITNQSTILQSWFSEQYMIPDLYGYKPKLLSFSQFLVEQEQQEMTDTTGNSIIQYINAMIRYAFFTSSTELGELTTPIAIITTLIMVLLLRQIKSILLPIFSNYGKRMAIQTHGEIWVQQNTIRIIKFGEYIFRLLYHSCISIYGIIAFAQSEVWWQDRQQTIQVFKGYPHHPISSKMAWYYILQSSYNIDALITLLTMSFTIEVRSVFISNNNNNNNRRKKYNNKRSFLPIQFPIVLRWSNNVRGDFQEMFIHHIVTNALVIGSSMLRFTRIGSMVFLIHDISDVPVDLSKLANFLKWKVTTIACFGTMAITWFYTRLYILPFYIYYTVLTKSHYVLEYGSVPVLLYVCYRHFFYIFLGLLILLHTVWFMMFVRMFLALVVKREIHDYSEHKHGEPPPISTTTTTNADNTTEGKKLQ